MIIYDSDFIRNYSAKFGCVVTGTLPYYSHAIYYEYVKLE
jgi:hypothetical protein